MIIVVILIIFVNFVKPRQKTGIRIWFCGTNFSKLCQSGLYQCGERVISIHVNNVQRKLPNSELKRNVNTFCELRFLVYMFCATHKGEDTKEEVD